MGNLCSMIDVDLPPRTPPRLHASEIAPPGYAAERLQQLHIGGSGEVHKRPPQGPRSPDRRTAAAAALASSDALSPACPAENAAAPPAGGDDGWRIPAGMIPADGDGDERPAIDLPEPEPQAPFSWTKGELIGIGAFGRVFTGLNNVTGEIIAVKQVSFAKDEALQGRVSEHIRALECEVELLRGLKHENIVQYLGTERTSDSMYIFLEYVHGGSISSLLAKFGPFQEAVIRVYTRQILRGLEYLHARGIMHRDIKGANILVDKGSTVKLADFGASKKIENLATVGAGCNSIRGTPYWMAPEVIKQTGHGRPADIWSVGCTVIEMATGKPPWSNYAAPVAAMFQIASSKDPPPIPEHLSPQAKDFLMMCFNRVARDRASASRLLKHPFVAESPPPQPPPQPFSFAAGPARAASGAAAAAAAALVQQQAQQGARNSPKRLPAAVQGERSAGLGSGTQYAGRGGGGGDGAAAGGTHPSPLRGAQYHQQQGGGGASEQAQQSAAAGATAAFAKQQQQQLNGRPTYSPLSSSRAGHPALQAAGAAAAAAAQSPGPAAAQAQAQQQQQQSHPQHQPSPAQAQQQEHAQAEAQVPPTPPTQQQQHSEQKPQPAQPPAAQQQQQQQQQAPPRHSVVACQTLVDFNPVEEPSWLPEYIIAARGAPHPAAQQQQAPATAQKQQHVQHALLLPPRRRTVYDDPDDDAATAEAGALAAQQRRPVRRLTEAGHGVAALDSMNAAAAAIAVAVGAPAAQQQRPSRRYTEAGNGVAAPERALRLQQQQQSAGTSSRASPQLSQQSSVDGFPDQDTAPRGADSPRGAPGAASSPKLPRQQQHAAAAKGPLGRGLAAARARSPHDSLGSSADALVFGGRKAVQQLMAGGPDSDASCTGGAPSVVDSVGAAWWQGQGAQGEGQELQQHPLGRQQAGVEDDTQLGERGADGCRLEQRSVAACMVEQ